MSISMRSLLGTAVALSTLAALVACAGCVQQRKPSGPTVTQAWERPARPESDRPLDAATPAPENQAPDPTPASPEPEIRPPAEPIAYVNGRAIARRRATDILIDAYGLDVVELLIRLELAKETAASLGLAASLEDVRAEYDLALRSISSPVLGPEDDDSDRPAAERVLDGMLARNGVSKTQFMLKIEQDAYLRKVADRDLVVDDGLLTAEHDRAYGPRVQVRHMQLNSLAEVSQVRAELDAGVDFELLVRKYSRNEVTAAAGGLLPPFSRHDDVPPLLREAAFELQEGQISNAIREDGTYHLIRLERRFPPTEISADLVRDELRTRLHRRLVEQRMRQLAADLFDAADIQLTDPTLLRRFREKHPNARLR